MRITIDNLDGLGAIDYTEAVAAEGPITVQRALNEPSRCTAEIVLGIASLIVPVRRGRVIVTTDDAALLFTGYLATEPVRIYAGNASTGPVYRARVTAGLARIAMLVLVRDCRLSMRRNSRKTLSVLSLSNHDGGRSRNVNIRCGQMK